MKSVKIEPSLLEFKTQSLMRALLLLNDNGFILCARGVPDSVREIIMNEGIRLLESDRCDYVIELTSDNMVSINSSNKFPDLFEAVKSLTELKRESALNRVTKETKINIKLNLDGNGIADVTTGIGFFDHMLDQIARHGNIDLEVKVDGDLHVDEHHTVEDVGIALGEAILKALGDKKGIKRYGYFLPMDDTIAQFTMDIGGRQYLNFKCKFSREYVGEFPTELTEEFFKGVSQGLKANLYVRAKGKNDHHKIEAIFKAFAKSLNEACRIDERAKGKLPTTKGVI